MNKQWIHLLTEQLKKPLPGYEAQKQMEPPMRDLLDHNASNAINAATLLTLYYDTEWKFILIRRSSHPLDKHKGQISFPGGRMELKESASHASFRETNEEINVPIDNLTMLGPISPLYIPVSNFMVYPHIAYLDIETIEFKRQEKEVEEIIHVPLHEFLDKNNSQYKTIKMNNGYSLKEVPVFNLQGHIVWGATAMMLSEFREICKMINN